MKDQKNIKKISDDDLSQISGGAGVRIVGGSASASGGSQQGHAAPKDRLGHDGPPCHPGPSDVGPARIPAPDR